MTAMPQQILLNNGVEMPTVGLGVYMASPQDTVSAVASAIASGYRLIDTAKAYHNEAQVGEGIRKSGLDRGELFVTTKLFNGDYGYTEAWSPIGGVKNYGNWDAYGGKKDPLTDPVITAIARAHGKSSAQVILRWHLQNNVVAIPKSVNARRIAENIDVFDFTLSAAEMAQIDGLDAGMRAGPDPREVDTTSFADLA